jgi:hypothetical protein
VLKVTPGATLEEVEWHDIVWEVQKYGMKLLVDGQLRFENRKAFRPLNAKVGIGPFIVF